MSRSQPGSCCLRGDPGAPEKPELRLSFNPQLIIDAEHAGDAIRPDAGQVAIHLIGDHALQPQMPVLHDDVNRWKRPEAVARGKRRVSVDGAIHGTADLVVHW